MATTTAALTATTREPENGGDLSKTINMRGLKQSIETNLSYLIKDPKHEHEKPYTVNYDTGGVIPRTNTKNESKPVVVQNFRDIQDARSFEEYGFGSAKIDSALASAEFNDEARVEEVYYPAVKKVLWKMFPDATRIETLEHGVITCLLSYSRLYTDFSSYANGILNFLLPPERRMSSTSQLRLFTPVSLARYSSAAVSLLNVRLHA